jgi:hypothetical protein
MLFWAKIVAAHCCKKEIVIELPGLEPNSYSIEGLHSLGELEQWDWVSPRTLLCRFFSGFLTAFPTQDIQCTSPDCSLILLPKYIHNICVWVLFSKKTKKNVQWCLRKTQIIILMIWNESLTSQVMMSESCICDYIRLNNQWLIEYYYIHKIELDMSPDVASHAKISDLITDTAIGSDSSALCSQ